MSCDQSIVLYPVEILLSICIYFLFFFCSIFCSFLSRFIFCLFVLFCLSLSVFLFFSVFVYCVCVLSCKSSCLVELMLSFLGIFEIMYKCGSFYLTPFVSFSFCLLQFCCLSLSVFLLLSVFVSCSFCVLLCLYFIVTTCLV